MTTAHPASAIEVKGSNVLLLLVVAVILGILGGAAYLHVAESVSVAGWRQNSVEDGWTVVIGDVTLLSITWIPSIVTPLAQSITSTFVPPVVGLAVGVSAALAAVIGCHVGRRDLRTARRSGVIFAGIVILASGSVLSVITGSVLALLYAGLLGALGAALVFGAEALIDTAHAGRSRRI